MPKREEEEFERRRDNVKEKDIDDVLEKEYQIISKAHGPLGKFANEITALFSLLKDYSNGSYREVPWQAVAGIVGSLLYIFSPIDLVPDVIPFIGLVDDAAVLGICLKSISSVLVKYKSFKYLASNVKQITGNVFDTCMDSLLRQVEEWFNVRIQVWQKNFRYTLGFDAVFLVAATLLPMMPVNPGIVLLWCTLVVRLGWTGLCFYRCVRDFYPNRSLVCRFSLEFFRELWQSYSISVAIKQTVRQAFFYYYYERTPDLVKKVHHGTSFIGAAPSVNEMAEKAAEKSCPLLQKYMKIMTLFGLFFILFYGVLIVFVRLYLVQYAVNMSITHFLLLPIHFLHIPSGF